MKLGKDQREFKNAGRPRSGRVNLQRALTVSSDVYFYTAGDDFWQVWNNGDKERGPRHPDDGRASSASARTTGIELDEADGPDPRPGVEAGDSPNAT